MDHASWITRATFFEIAVYRVVYKVQQPAKFAGFSARFCQLFSLLHESRCFEEVMFIRSKLLGLNNIKKLNCLSFLKSNYKRLLIQGQFKNVVLETVFLNKSCCGGRKV